MKSKLKSVLLIVLMLVSIAGIALTVNQAKERTQNNHVVINNQQMPPDMQENGGNQPPSAPDNNVSQNEEQTPEMPMDTMNDFKAGNNGLRIVHIITIGAFSTIFSICFVYLIMSIRNKNVFINTDKIIIFILSVALLTSYLTAGISVAANHFVLKNDKAMGEVQTEKDQIKLDESNTVNSEKIDLNNQKTDVTITKGGSYELSGEFSNSVIVDAENEEVELVLNNVKITNEKTAAIIGLSAKSITINIKDNTENTLSDGGNSEYDGCIFSNTELIFNGNGKLVVNGNQNEGEGIATETANITINSGDFVVTSNDDGINAGGDGATITINGGNIYVDASGDGIDSNKNAVINGGTLFVLGSDVGGDAGIDTDGGYVINGGTVVALGSDMIETPEKTGRQNTIAFTLNEKIDKDNMVSLMKGDEAIVSFIASKSFKTVIISSASLVNGDYKLYTENLSDKENNYGIDTKGSFTTENPVSVNNQDTFNVNSTVNSFGNSGGNFQGK